MKDVLSNAHRHYVLCVVDLFGGQPVILETIINSGYILPTLRRRDRSCPHLWEYFSFSRWVERGRYTLDWGCTCQQRID